MQTKRRLLSLLLCLALALSLTACSSGSSGSGGSSPDSQSSSQSGSGSTSQEGETYLFTDSTGRQVELPREITRVASAGSLANIMLYAVKPEVIVGWSSRPSGVTEKYIAPEYLELPEYGSFYSGSEDFNREALMTSDPQVIIDVGEWDEEYKADLDALQEQVGIPVILIEANIDQNASAYRTLGQILGAEERAEKLAAYCDEVVSDAKAKAATIAPEDRVTVYYGQDDGLSTILSGTIHSQIYELVGAEIVVQADNVQVQQGGGVLGGVLGAKAPDDGLVAGGLQIPAEQAVGQPEKGVAPVQAQRHIRQRLYYVVAAPDVAALVGRPPGPNRVIGIRWLGNLLYPDVFDYDIEQEVKDYFSLFYQYDLTDQEVTDLLANSTLKAQAQREA